MTGPVGREEVEAAFLARNRLGDADDWAGFAGTFTEDAVYVEHEMGRFEGRQAITDWLVAVMAPLTGWTYPVQWHVVDGDRVVYCWANRLPPVQGHPPFEFLGVTNLIYGGEGLWRFQEDFYNMKECDRVIAAWSAVQGGG